jgi:carbonic anhydrase
MQKLVDGIAVYQQVVYPNQKKLMLRLAKKQAPLALFITCADSRICPNLLTQTDPGDLFILRVAGNIVPAYGAVHGGEAATIEFAVSELKVRHVVLCGHSLCGAMNAVLHPEPLANLPALKSYLGHAEATRRIMAEKYPHVQDDAERLTLAVQENVLVQTENLKTHPAVASALARGELELHRWVYQLENGRVLSYVPDAGQFLPLESVNLNACQSERLQQPSRKRATHGSNTSPHTETGDLAVAAHGGNGLPRARSRRNGVASP